MTVKERSVQVGGSSTRYMVAGEGPPLVLLHGIGTSSLEWNRSMAALARGGRSVYAPDLLQPERGKDHAGYSPSSLAYFIGEFMDALGIDRAAVAGNSLGGLVALRFALSYPSRVSALVLVDSAGLGREVSPALALAALPVLGEVAVCWTRTPFGAAQRPLGRAPLLFTTPALAPPEWLAEHARLGRARGFMQTTITALRSHIGPGGQRGGEILLDELARLGMPTLVVWGASDKVLPLRHAYDAVARLRHGKLEILPGCGHLPHVECPKRFAEALARFLDG